MSSAGKFWPRALVKLGLKKEPPPAFVPTRDLAARIVNGTGPQAQTPGDAAQTDVEPNTPAPGPASAANDHEGSRESSRFVPNKTSTTLTDTRNKSIRARIMNLSATGVAIEADFRMMPIETVIMVGAKPVHLGRSIRGGQVFLFDKPLDPARCNPQIVL